MALWQGSVVGFAIACGSGLAGLRRGTHHVRGRRDAISEIFWNEPFRAPFVDLCRLFVVPK